MKAVSLLILILMSALLGACATNPVTGERTGACVGNIRAGDWKKQYAPSRQMQGGDYTADPKLSAYVQSVGNWLAAVSDRKLPMNSSS